MLEESLEPFSALCLPLLSCYAETTERWDYWEDDELMAMAARATDFDGRVWSFVF